MGLVLDERANFNICRFRGDCSESACPDLNSTLAEWIKTGLLNLIWDFSELEKICPGSFGALAGSMTMQLLRSEPVIAIRPYPLLASYFSACGLSDRIVAADNLPDALAKLILRVPKRYDHFFFDVLVKEGYLSPAKVGDYLDQMKFKENRTDVGLRLVREGVLTPQQLLSCIALQKTRLGEILLESGLLSEHSLRALLKVQFEAGARERLGDILLRLGIASNEELYEALTRQVRRRKQLSSNLSFSKPRRKTAKAHLLGEILVESNLIGESQLQAVVQRQKSINRSQPLGQILRDLGLVTDSDLYRALMTQYKRKREKHSHSGDASALDELVSLLDTDDYLQIHRVRRAVLPMGRSGLQALTQALESDSENLRRNAAWLLGETCSTAACPFLVTTLNDSCLAVVDAAGWSLIRLSNQLLSYTDHSSWDKWCKKNLQQDTDTPFISTSVHELEDELNKILSSENKLLSDTFIEYRVGLAHWYGGRTTIYMKGSGLVLASNLYKGRWTFFEGRINKAQFMDILSRIVDTCILHSHSLLNVGTRDQSLHDIAVGIEGRYRSNTFLWYNEVVKNAAFSSCERHLRSIMHIVTSGQFW